MELLSWSYSHMSLGIQITSAACCLLPEFTKIPACFDSGLLQWPVLPTTVFALNTELVADTGRISQTSHYHKDFNNTGPALNQKSIHSLLIDNIY